MMKILRSKEVLAALVALVVAVAAVLGLDLNGEALTAAITVLAGAAGALGGALVRSQASTTNDVLVLRDDAQRNFLDQWAETGGRVHAQAMGQPFIYPDDGDDEDDGPIYISDLVVEHNEQLAVLRERIEQLEQSVFAKG